MSIILKDKNGNQLNRVKNYCATDEQVKKAIALAVEEGKIVVPTSVNYENFAFATCDRANELEFITTELGTFSYYTGETQDTIDTENILTRAGKKMYIDCSNYDVIYISAKYLKEGYNALYFYLSDKAVANNNSDNPNKLYKALTIPPLAFSNVSIGDTKYFELSIPAEYPYLVVLNSDLNPTYYDIKITDKKETIVNLNDDYLIKAIKNYGLTDNIESLSNKTALFLGDSYTYAMCGNAKGNGTQVTTGEYYELIKNLKMKNGYAYGIVSSTIRTGNNGGGYSYEPMATRVDTMITEHSTDDVGLVIFMGGTNDSAGVESSLGTSLWDADTDHIYGACHHIFNSIKQTWKDAILLVILQPSCANCEVTESPEGLDISSFTTAQKSVVKSQIKQKIVKEVAELYKLPIVDCCFDWYTPLNFDDLATYWSDDNLHLTNLGYREIRKKAENKIREILKV